LLQLFRTIEFDYYSFADDISLAHVLFYGIRQSANKGIVPSTKCDGHSSRCPIDTDDGFVTIIKKVQSSLDDNFLGCTTCGNEEFWRTIDNSDRASDDAGQGGVQADRHHHDHLQPIDDNLIAICHSTCCQMTMALAIHERSHSTLYIGHSPAIVGVWLKQRFASRPTFRHRAQPSQFEK
jgi:hypothetical protein